MGTLLDPLTGLSINTTNGYSENAYLLPNDGLIMSSGSPNDFCINDSDQQTTQWKNNTRYVKYKQLWSSPNNPMGFVD